MRKEEKEVLYKILAEKRECACGVTFYCTSQCPEKRWHGTRKEFQSSKACYCKACLVKARFTPDYLEGRLKYCYFFE